MGVLTCKLFTAPRNEKLERCAVKDSDHITPGSVGDHVKCIQIALNQLSNVFLTIDGIYGSATAAAVVAFKEAQSPPLRQRWQSVADNIVGIRTITELDKQYKAFEDAPQPITGYISETHLGTRHDHNQCEPFLDSENHMFEGKWRISHRGTPINPQGFGKMVSIGGTNEVKYLGFENYVPDPKQDPHFQLDWVHDRKFTRLLRDHTVSDICFRSAPIDDFMQKELKRIAMPGCRLTYAGNSGKFARYLPYLWSLGPQIQSTALPSDTYGPFEESQYMHVVVISMQNLR